MAGQDDVVDALTSGVQPQSWLNPNWMKQVNQPGWGDRLHQAAQWMYGHDPVAQAGQYAGDVASGAAQGAWQGAQGGYQAATSEPTVQRAMDPHQNMLGPIGAAAATGLYAAAPVAMGAMGGAIRGGAEKAGGEDFARQVEGVMESNPELGGAAHMPLTAEEQAAQRFSAAAAERSAAHAGDRISTRIPWNLENADATMAAHAATGDNALTVGTDTSRLDQPSWTANADTVNRYPGVKGSALGGIDADSKAESFIEHAKNNLLAIYDSVPRAIKARSMLWYDGANQIAHDWADQYGHIPRAVAGAMASLSPQMDWFKNVDLTKRILDIRRDQQATTLTPQMEAWGNSYMQGLQDKAVKATAAGKPRTALNATNSIAEISNAMDRFRSTPFGQLQTPRDKAIWTRMYDEGHNDRSYPVLSPEGQALGPALNKDKTPSAVGWGGFGDIAKAHSVLDDPSLANISLQMGGAHKVRNFYNNIIAPHAPFGDVTVDTHAIASSLLRPLAGGHTEVAEGLGAEGSHAPEQGSSGMYNLYAEAHRRAAAERGILPRQMQSVTWEAGRGLFEPEFKREGYGPDVIDNVWNGYGNGQYDLAEAHRRINQIAGGVAAPEWHGFDAGANAGAGPAADQRSVYRYELGRTAAGPVERGGGVGYSPALTGPANVGRGGFWPEQGYNLQPGTDYGAIPPILQMFR